MAAGEPGRENDNQAESQIVAYLTTLRILSPAANCAFSLLSGGNSHITWRLQSQDAIEGFQDLVIKVAQPDGPLAPYDVAHEAQMMRLAQDLGAAVPAVVGHSVSATGDCDFIVMKHVAGEAPSIWDVPKWIAAADDGFRLRLGCNLLGALRPLQSLGGNASSNLPSVYDAYLQDMLALLRREADGLFALPPTLQKASDWLRSNCRELDASPALSHGDFRLGNIVVDRDQVAAVLDWERAMVGHPLHDVGYFCLPAMRTGERLCGVLTEDELVACWRSEFGEQLDIRLCAFFRIMSMYTEFCAMVRALGRVVRGQGRIVIARTLPLVARLHHDLIVGIREWENGQFHL